MKDYIYAWLLKKLGQEYLLQKILTSVEWYDQDLAWTPQRKDVLLSQLAKNEHFNEYMHYIWARDNTKMFELVAMGERSRSEQLVKYGAMARVASIIAQLRAHKKVDKPKIVEET